MKCLLAFCAAGIFLASSGVAGTSPIYVNSGNVTAPVIDATAFVNSGTFNAGGTSFIIGGITFISSGIPYSTQNTLYYTNLNSGRITAGVGFEFDYATEIARYPADTFVNRGTVDSTTFLLINATNVYNTGLLLGSERGFIQIKGDNVSLTRSGLRTGLALDSSGGGISIGGAPTGSNFRDGDGYAYIDPTDVAEVYWGAGTYGLYSGDGTAATGTGYLLQLSQLNLPRPRSQQHQVLDTSGRTNVVAVPTSSPGPFAAFAFTNMLTQTNPIVQVVFVPTNYVDTNFSVQVRFAPGANPEATPNTQVAMVQMMLWDIDAVTGLPVTNYLYFTDRGATTTNFTLVTNLVSTNLAKPFPHEVTRQAPVEWASGKTNNTVFTNTLIMNPKYVNTTVTNDYAAYSVVVGRQASASMGQSIFSGLFGFYDPFREIEGVTDPTNSSGRIEILAKNLDLDLSRMRAEGLVTIKAENYLGKPPAKFDAPNFTFDLGSTNGFLSVSNVVPVSVRRFEGTVRAWTGVWTNQFETVGPGENPEAGDVTNYVDMVFHTLILEPTFQTIVPVTIRDFIMRSDDIVDLRDRLVVNGNLEVQAPSLIVGNELGLSDLGDAGATNFVGVMNLTNTGSISAANLLNFGEDRELPYSNVVNRGLISASSILVAAETIDNSGSMQASRGLLSLRSAATKLDRSRTSANGDVVIRTGELKARNSVVSSGTVTTNASGQRVYQPGTLILDVRDMLTDGDSLASNRWSTVGGLSMLSKPPLADLLGTRLTSYAQQFGEVIHTWPAEDFGATPEGFTNNAAFGQLTLDGSFNSLFTFSGASASNALYVDYLDLRGYASNYLSALHIQTNMTLYFGYANLPVEELDGKLDNRLRWVRSYAGPLSGTNIIAGSSTNRILVNRGLAASATIDSDGDGTSNATDQRPFDGVRLLVSVTNQPALATLLSWRAAASTQYHIEYVTNVLQTNWTHLATYLSGTNSGALVTVPDPEAPAQAERYYRVHYRP